MLCLTFSTQALSMEVAKKIELHYIEYSSYYIAWIAWLYRILLSILGLEMPSS
jgi:hypothetical protein